MYPDILGVACPTCQAPIGVLCDMLVKPPASVYHEARERLAATLRPDPAAPRR